MATALDRMGEGMPGGAAPHGDPAAGAPVDRRSSRRHATVLLVGHVRHLGEGGGAGVCLVHDISPEGLMARFPALPVVGQEVEIGVRGLSPARASVRWVRGYKAGLAFAERQDLSGVVGRSDGRVPRAPRFEVAVATLLLLGGERLVVELLDISPGGAKLITDVPLAPGSPVQLVLPGSPETAPATVCWTRGDRSGLRFAAPLDMGTLARVIALGDIAGS
jgi:hypothetical protein